MTLEQFISKLADVVVNPLIKLIITIAFVVFLWGVYQYIRSAESSEGRDVGRKHIIWGIVGMLIMLGVFSIIKIALKTVYD